MLKTKLLAVVLCSAASIVTPLHAKDLVVPARETLELDPQNPDAASEGDYGLLHLNEGSTLFVPYRLSLNIQNIRAELGSKIIVEPGTQEGIFELVIEDQISGPLTIISNGTNGLNGQRGRSGQSGRNAACRVETRGFKITVREDPCTPGSPGMFGGHGNPGGPGGKIQVTFPAEIQLLEVEWSLSVFANGGNGGHGGDGGFGGAGGGAANCRPGCPGGPGGNGGNGGQGGDGGALSLLANASLEASEMEQFFQSILTRVHFEAKPGEGGYPGKGGVFGAPGSGASNFLKDGSGSLVSGNPGIPGFGGQEGSLQINALEQ